MFSKVFRSIFVLKTFIHLEFDSHSVIAIKFTDIFRIGKFKTNYKFRDFLIKRLMELEFNYKQKASFQMTKLTIKSFILQSRNITKKTSSNHITQNLLPIPSTFIFKKN